ncbi:MAG: LuxR C-terminal-related transcriptional regulator [Chloroflexi bacterium]|nr:LuxR C-terminal-related transcriptional regulator [Chloroflexota bacterium]
MAEPKEPLTERELEVVKLVAEGASNKQIAATLFISENTVKAHLKSIFVKLEAESRAKVAAIAQRNGWVQRTEEASLIVQAAYVEVPAKSPIVAGVHNSTTPSEEISPAIKTQATAPVPVAPNPQPPQPLARSRRIALVLVTLIIAMGGAWSMQLPLGRAEREADPEFISGAAVPETAETGNATRWFTRAPLPTARTRSAAFTVSGLIYLIGGTLERQAVGETLIYEPRTNVWRDGTPKPTPLRFAAGAVLSDVIYIPAGTDAAGAPTTNFEAYDALANRWTELPPLPHAMSGQVVAASSGRIFVFGGRRADESFNTEGYAYDPAQRRWTRVAALPTARSQAAAAAFEGRIYVVGGTDGRHEFTTCEMYDVATDHWTSCRPMSIARGGLGLAQIGASLYVIGGGVASNYIPFNERYDIAADRWLPFEIPASRAGIWKNPAVASLPTEFYVIGGATALEARGESFVYEVLTNKSFLPNLQNSAP